MKKKYCKICGNEILTKKVLKSITENVPYSELPIPVGSFSLIVKINKETVTDFKLTDCCCNCTAEVNEFFKKWADHFFPNKGESEKVKEKASINLIDAVKRHINDKKPKKKECDDCMYVSYCEEHDDSEDEEDLTDCTGCPCYHSFENKSSGCWHDKRCKNFEQDIWGGIKSVGGIQLGGLGGL